MTSNMTSPQPKAKISTVEHVPSISLESALPTGQSAASMLAPEEVFAARTSDLRSRSEMAPAEKRAARVKSRKMKQKNRDLLNKSVDKLAKVRVGARKEKQKALESVVKSGKGVTVVGKERKDLVKKKRK